MPKLTLTLDFDGSLADSLRAVANLVDDYGNDFLGDAGAYFAYHNDGSVDHIDIEVERTPTESKHKSLEYAFPTSETATRHGYGNGGCWYIATYTYAEGCQGYSKSIVDTYPDNESGKQDAIDNYVRIDLPVNVWSCQTVRHPELLAQANEVTA